MLRDQIQLLIEDAVARLVSEGFLPKEGLPAVEVADPKDPAHGDFACSFALAASKAAGKPPREIAERLAGEVAGHGSQVAGDEGGLIASAEIAGPGFINLRLRPEAIAAFVGTILDLGIDGLRSATNPQSAIRNPQSLNIEYVSVNPNGPITVGSGRGAAFGSTLANVLEAAGHPVHREYYINDGTNSEQMRLFAESVRARIVGEDPPAAGYKGDYVEEVGTALRCASQAEVEVWYRETVAELESWNLEVRTLTSLLADDEFQHEDIWRSLSTANWMTRRIASDAAVLASCLESYALVREAAIAVREVGSEAIRTLSTEAIQRLSQRLMLARQQADLTAFSTNFDTWFSEQSLHDSGAVAACIEDLKAKGAADQEPYQTQVHRKKGEPDEVERVSQEQAEVSDVQDEGTEGQRDEGTPDQSAIRNPQSEIGTTLWLRSTKFGDDKDRVLRRKDGRLTYIASDVAYHKDKFNRGSKPDAEGKVQPADKLITILGPDHHGYIGRLTAVVGALLEVAATDRTYRSDKSYTSYPLSETEALLFKGAAERDACLAAVEEAKKKLEVIIFQIVRFVKDGKPAPMRKRDGNIYSLRDLMLEIGKNAAPNPQPGESADEHEKRQMAVGKDVARFFYLMRSHDSHMDFDLDLAEKQSDENPVYYVQYAHARICSVIAKAREAGMDLQIAEDGKDGKDGRDGTDGSGQPFPPFLSLPSIRLDLLAHPKELALIKTILDLPHEVRRCAEDYGVHRLTTYAMDLARAYHHFYDACRVIQPENPELSRARLALCHAARIGLRAVFELLGISAPERMDRDETPAATSNA